LAANVAGTNISASFDSGTGTLNLSGADTLVNYRNVLRTIRYENTSEEPSGALRSVRLILNDGDRNSLPVVREIAVTPVNDAPAFGLPPMPLSVAENTAAGTLIHTVVVNDVDSTDDVVLSIAAGNTGNAFVIDTVTGQIRVNNSAALDFEVTPSFVLQILATDSSPVAPTPLTVQQNITINLTDLSEPFVIGPNAFSTGDVTLVRDGGNLRAVRAGTMTDVVPASAFANVASVVVDGRLNTADLLTVDFSAGDPIPAGGFSFSGKAGPGTDKLILTGAAATAVTQTFMMADSGGLDIDGQSVVYDGLEAVADQLTVQSRIFNFGNASSQVTLSDGDAPADGQSRLTSRLSGNTVDFSSPVLSLMLRLGNGDDDLETDSIDSTFDASVMVMGSGGNDQLSLAGFNNGPVTITGGAGSDTIDGGSGDDLLSGGTGADEFLSSPGDDMAQGNAGADVFHDRADDGNDVFQGGAGQDQVVLSSPTVPQVNISSDSVDTGQLLVPSKSSTSVVTFDGTEAVHVDSLVEETLTVDYSEFTVSMDALLTELEGTASITGAGLFDIFFGTDSEELVIIGGQADDVFTVTGLQAFTSGLSIDGDSGSDQAIVPGGLP
ncbi:MAG: cadherin domain-containing protein, partial [Planctomycetaceae bacterium]